MDMHRRIVGTSGVLSAALLVVSSVGATAQDEPRPSVAEVNSGAVSGSVTIDGVVLEPKRGEDDEYLFSDGTGVTVIDVDDDPPLLTPVTIVGQVTSDDIDVSSWAPADAVMADAGPAAEAFMAWVAVLRGDDVAAAGDGAGGDGEADDGDATASDGAAVEQLVVSGRGEVRVTGPASVQCDAGGEVYVQADQAEVTVTGACREVIVRSQASTIVVETTNELYVDGSANTITATEARELDVNGNGNTISLERVREIYVEGNDNTISFVEGGQDVDDEGRGNTIARS